MPAVAIRPKENMVKPKRRLANKVKQRSPLFESAAYQRQYARVRKAFLAHEALFRQTATASELLDDVIVTDKRGRRIPKPEYATLRIDQLPQFKKG